MKVDLISDLHIDHWDLRIKCDHPCGERKSYPFFDVTDIKPGSEVLIIAGDISDDIDISIDFMNQMCQYYKMVMYVEGNHEHIEKYPQLYTKEEIAKKIEEKGNKKIIYLPQTSVIWRNTLFIGCCGWWDYCNNSKQLDYFNSTDIVIGEDQIENFHQNVKKRAQEEAVSLLEKLEKYKNNNQIKQIIVVTHTVPINIFLDKDLTDSKYNSCMEEIKENDKINYWLFGHTHEELTKQDIRKITYITNPRGRPSDYDRQKFNIKTIKIEKFRKNIFG